MTVLTIGRATGEVLGSGFAAIQTQQTFNWPSLIESFAIFAKLTTTPAPIFDEKETGDLTLPQNIASIFRLYDGAAWEKAQALAFEQNLQTGNCTEAFRNVFNAFEATVESLIPRTYVTQLGKRPSCGPIQAVIAAEVNGLPPSDQLRIRPYTVCVWVALGKRPLPSLVPSIAPSP